MAASVMTDENKVSSSQPLLDVPDGVSDTLKCVFCRLYLSCGPIRCNSDGDGICGRCMPCGNNPNETYRNLLYEKSMAAMKFPCIYDKFGCIEKLQFDQVTAHENNCQFKQVVCPSLTEDCNWEGSVKDLREHVEQHNLILKNNTFEVDTKQDSRDRNVIFIIEENLIVLLQYKYVSNEKILYFDAVHFCDANSEIICNLKFVNKSDTSLYAPFKPFYCKPYVSKYLDVAKVQKIDFNRFMTFLEDPEVVSVGVFFVCKNAENFHLKSSSKKSLDKVLCFRCCTYMVPPILGYSSYVGRNRHTEQCCKNCSNDSLPYEDLNIYCKELNYPCRWKCCHFVGKHYNIRQHEFKCNYAMFDCPLSCDGNFNLCSFLKHLDEVHNAERFHEKITVALTSEGTSCYTCYDDQLLILQIFSTDSNSNVEIKNLNLVSNYDYYDMNYHFVHSHCNASTKSYVVRTERHVNNGTVRINMNHILKPLCFQKYDEGFSIVISICQANVE